MGMRRGSRNRAKEKVWPGQDAARVREDKHGTVAQMEKRPSIQGACSNGDAGSTPAGSSSLTDKQIRKMQPESTVALLHRQRNAESGITKRTPWNMKLIGRSKKSHHFFGEKNKERAELFRFIQAQYDKSKVDLFKLICRLNSTVEYALPECWHELDPEALFSMLEDYDFPRFAIAMGYSELEIRKFSARP